MPIIHEVKSFSHYCDFIKENFPENSLYRGVKSADYTLIPSYGRYFKLFAVLLNRLEDTEGTQY